ncbi:MAG: FtsX-like permease family protein, partial [Verrucomicrobia bacterium]|nr:FtsX-like permease family protein [Verrucomicrobiota bacterium]
GSNAPAGEAVWLGDPLATQLGASVGDELVLRIHKPSALSRDAVLTPRDDQSVALRLRVDRILSPIEGGRFGLDANQAAALNAFVSYDTLARAAGLEGRMNLLIGEQLSGMETPTRGEKLRFKLQSLLHDGWKALDGELGGLGRPLAPDRLATAMHRLTSTNWTLEDAELSIRSRPEAEGRPGVVELTSRRIFLDGPAEVAAGRTAPEHPPIPILTYLVNSLEAPGRRAPYSMVTAAGPPYTPADMPADGIMVNQWLADDLALRPGDPVQLTYYRADSGPTLVEFTNTFRVHGIVPMTGIHADRSLMPEFPGLAKAESTRDWDAGFDLVHPIRDQDEAYWKQWRGTPKAFISLAAGQRLWTNRFGNLTAIRWTVPPDATSDAVESAVRKRVWAGLWPEDFGLVWQPVAESGRRAASTGQDFGGLFLGFSFFLIVAALVLTSMLFQFALERRTSEVGLLLALGWTGRRVRRLLLTEGLILAALGTAIGVVGGLAYARGILAGLNTLWRDAVAGGGLSYHATPASILTGALLGFVTAGITLLLALRGQARHSVRALLEDSDEVAWESPGRGRGRWGSWIARLAGVSAVLLCGWGFLAPESRQPMAFFGAGATALVAGALGFRHRLAAMQRPAARVRALSGLAWRGLSRRPSRSTATVVLLACAAFLLVVVAASRLDAGRDAAERAAGTGGFAWWGEATLPVTQDLNSGKGREFFGLDDASLVGASVVPFRVRDGDEASCLNLNRAQQPRLLGVSPADLASRGAFTFTALAPGLAVTNGWLALEAPAVSSDGVPEVPAIGDGNSIQWALGRRIGDTLDFLDERGRPFRIRLVGAVANSVLQGSLVIAESEFVQRFPSESGHRVFLVDAPPDRTAEIGGTLSRALSDVGLELTPAAVRLNRFNAVQNTYLNTFQILGGLGLLLGSVGLGVVVLRNVQERRGELALMRAVGFPERRVRRLVLLEHGFLLVAGLLLGVVAALLAVLPSVLRPGSGIPWASLGLTFAIVALNGLLWAWIATRGALKGRLLASLRDL